MANEPPDVDPFHVRSSTFKIGCVPGIANFAMLWSSEITGQSPLSSLLVRDAESWQLLAPLSPWIQDPVWWMR